MKSNQVIHFLVLPLLIFAIFSCKDSSSEPSSAKDLKDGTQEMVMELKSLVDNGNPQLYYHWNLKRTNDLKGLMENAGNDKNPLWFQMVTEALNAGKSQMVINEVNNFAAQFGGITANNLTDTSKPLYELIAMAKLRLGEQENCQENHTPQSCILPLNPIAYHKLTNGSTGAIAVYKMLLTKYPDDYKFKWLLNLAYMTLGQHPEEVPTEWLIPFPNWNHEQNDFPKFNNIAEFVGIAENGLSGGVCIEDFNGDGYLDIFATSYGMSDQVKLFINDKKGRFSDQTKASGLTGIVSGLNTLHADFDNDGDRDILILRGAWLTKGGHHPNSLLRNNGNGTFSDVTEAAGLLSRHPTQTAAWADFNGDGWLDLFIGNESSRDDPNPSELYQNNGNGTFSNVISKWGINPDLGYVKGVIWGDINNDGKADLFVSILGSPNKLYQNIGDRFIDVSEKAGVSRPIHSFPTWFFDYDNDGFEDLFVCSYDNRRINNVAADYGSEVSSGAHPGEKSALYHNNGDGTFTNVAKDMGLDGSLFGMGCNFGDLDNDGFLDFYIGTGAPDLSSIVPNRMFRNSGGQKFEEVTSAGGFGHIQKGHGTAFSDLDNDGDQDIYSVMGGAFEGDFFSNILFENPGFNAQWITIELEGKTNNRDGIGARIKVITNKGNFYRSVNTGGSFGSSSLRQEIGLGDSKQIISIDIRWPNGKRQKFENVSLNQIIKIAEDNSAIIPLTIPVFDFKRPS